MDPSSLDVVCRSMNHCVALMATHQTKHSTTAFIVSTGRTGTKAIAQYLGNCFEDVTAVHEPKPSRRLRRASCARFANRMTKQQLADMLANSRRKMFQAVTTRVYVESNPSLFGFVDVLPVVFDQPLIVHVVRDPRTMIRSALNFGSQRGLKWLFSAVIPNWVIKPEHVEKQPLKTWSQMTPVERFAWYWHTVNTRIQAATEQAPQRCQRMRFEDLFVASGNGMRDLASWIGLTEKPGLLQQMLGEKVNASRGKDVGPWQDWSAEDRHSVYEYCGELMNEYGYTND